MRFRFSELNHYLCIIGCLSFASGLCFVLSGSTLIIFLNDHKLSLAEAGLFLIAYLPHVFKWAAVPWLEKIKHTDYRRQILQLSLLLKSLLLLCFSFVPSIPWFWFLLLLGLHLVSAAYECVLFISQVVGLKRNNWGFGEAAGVTGYRCGILAGGAGALALSASYSWNTIYMIFSGIMLLPLIPLYFSKVRFSPKKSIKIISYGDYLIKSWKNLAKNQPIWWLIAIMFFFRAQDAMQGQYITIYLINLGYDRSLISFIFKTLGIIMAAGGGFIAASAIRYYGVYKPLWIGLITHGASTIFLIMLDKDSPIALLYFTAACYELTKGLSITPLLSLQIMSCTKSYGIIQIAGLSSITVLSNIFFGAFGAQFIEYLGWTNFWILTTLINVPSFILLLIKSHHKITNI